MRLHPGENVLWATRKGFFSLSFVLAFLGMFGGLFLVVFGFLETSEGITHPPNPVLGWIGIILILVGLIYVIVSSIIAKSTKYILTNQRIMEVRFGKVIRQISMSDFMGRPLSQFLDKEAAGKVNNQPVYNIRITDPKSAEFMGLTSLNQRAVEELERICESARQVILCTYCRTKNSASSSTCIHCGASLQ